MRGGNDGKVNGETVKLPVSGGSRGTTQYSLSGIGALIWELYGKRRRGESKSEENWKEREVRFIFSSVIQRD